MPDYRVQYDDRMTLWLHTKSRRLMQSVVPGPAYALVMLGLLLVKGTSVLALPHDQPSWSWLFYACLVGFLLCVLGLAAELLAMLAQSRNAREVTVQLTPDGIETSTPVQRSRWLWAAFQDCVVIRERLLLFLTHRTALVIPKRAFTGDSQWQSFVTTCRDEVARAKAQPSAGKGAG
jgi:hypothetical protein